LKKRTKIKRKNYSIYVQFKSFFILQKTITKDKSAKTHVFHF